MEYIKNEHYDYIMNKYHDQSEPFDSLKRFVRNDKIFDESSGMCANDIIEGIKEQDKKIAGAPHPVRKAKAFCYVLQNTRISCDNRDIFPAINMIDRPLNKTLIAEWKKEVLTKTIPDVEKRRAYLEDNGIVTIWPDYDHSVPVWDRVFSLGFCGILRESEQMRQQVQNITPNQEAFYDGIKITYEGIIDFIKRLELQAQKQDNIRLANALKNIGKNVPGTFYEALLVNYLFFILCEHIDGLQVRSLGNFDRLFYPFYINDLKNGVSEQQIRKDLAYFFLQFTAIDNYWNQPVFLGGCKEDESTEINELSYIFMDVYDKMNIFNPKIQIKVASSTPEDFVLKALDMIRRGNNSIAFVSDATIRKALQNVGFTSEQARTCDIKGCYEYGIQGCYETASMNYLNLLKPLEFAMHNGYDGVSGGFSGLKSPKVTEYTTFDEFYDEYKKQLAHLIEQVIDISNSIEVHLSEINPLTMFSATVPTSIQKGIDGIAGGASHNGNRVMFGFMADIADSLTNIKKYVFDQKVITLEELTQNLDKDFEGNTQLYYMLRSDKDKYGNNKLLPDFFAKDISEFVKDKVCAIPGSKERGSNWNVGFHVARQSYTQAPKTLASPNGRHIGAELSKNLSASMGMNVEGATAAILSVTKIDATSFTCDASLDLCLHPSAVKGKDGLMAMYGLLKTFIKRNGHAVHMNVFDVETLRDAQKNPDKYKDLQIRVCGWNVYWNSISKQEQEGFIRQAGGLI